MTQPTQPSAMDPATPEAIAALRAHPNFIHAMRTSAAGLVALYQGGRLLNWLMDDRGRLLFGYFALYLHFSRRPADPASGLTPTRIKALCDEFGVCSPGRATAMLALMRAAGYLAPAAASDRRLRVLVATDRLIALLAARWRLHFTALASMIPEGQGALAAVDDPAFARHLTNAMFARFRAGFRFLTHAPGLELFAERNAGMLILMSLMTAGAEDDTVPPTRSVPISISGLARRFAVSRAHVLKLIGDAAKEGFIARSGAKGEEIAILPKLSNAARNVFATMYLFLAACAREALEETRKEGATNAAPAVADPI